MEEIDDNVEPVTDTTTEAVVTQGKKRGRKKKEESEIVIEQNNTQEADLDKPIPLVSFGKDGVRSINAPMDEAGMIDWRKLIPWKFIKINSLYAENKQIPLSEMDKEEEKRKAGDDNCVITMAGFNFLANLRGFKSIHYKPIVSTEDKVSTICTVKFDSFQCGGFHFPSQEVSAMASASFDSCTPEFQKYYEALAENRSFIRAVRRAFNLNVVGQEEVSTVFSPIKESIQNVVSSLPDEVAQMVKTPQEHLAWVIENKGRTLEELKGYLAKRGWGADDLAFDSLSDLTGTQSLEILHLIDSK